ncbi:MAG TPA: EAL domain-containing protein [Noviherbaspirillum sp.]|nr:EAL domain-containing protein [Noviherbaspirillum sp.]
MAAHTSLPAVLAMDAAGKIRSWSAECQWLFGLTPDEAVGKAFGICLAPGHEHDFITQVSAAGTKAVRRNIDLLANDRTAFTAALTIVPQSQGSGRAPGHYILIVEADRPGEVEKAPDTDAVLFKRFAESLPGPFYVLDQVGHLVLWNRVLEQATQMSAEELTGVHALDFFDEAQKATIKQKMRNAFELGKSSVEAWVIAKDGSRTPYLFNCARTMVDGMVCICGMGIDITERKKAEEILHLHKRAVHASVNGVVIARRDGDSNTIELVNPAFEDISGYSQDEIAGLDLLFICPQDVDQAEHRKVRYALQQCHSVHVVIRSRRKGGELFWSDLKIAPVANSAGTVTHFVGVLSDVTEAKHYETQLEHLANHDPLTGLANRNLLHNHMEVAIQQARRYGTLTAFAFMDVDNFKFINDTFGHAAGDQVLKVIAQRLRACVREIDTIARLGGDEFVIIFANQPNADHIVELLERIRHSIAEAITTEEQAIHVHLSIGVSVYPRDGTDAEALLRAADAAMYHAKFIGRNNYQFYSPDLNATVHKRLRLEVSLRHAIDRQEMFLLFQPKVDIKSGRIVGAEALVRWRHPVQGMLSPAEFIPVAEDTGLIVPLGDWVMSRACAVLKDLHDQGFTGFSIAVNLSSRQFKQRKFIDCVADHVHAAGLNPASLELELTESQLMDNPVQVAQLLSELKALGVRLSIDDFGTGYSSLSYLQKFPVDSIKIDRSFVHDVSKETEDAIITRAVISLGHNLNVKVIAEGVETKEQLAFLRHYKCDQIQGHYFSAPVNTDALRDLLESKRTLQFS